jgi:hypothetical protein
MRFSVEPRQGYLYAALEGRDTAAQMREFLLAVHAASKQHDCAKIVISIRRSRAVFKPEDYGLNSYVNELVTPACQIALVADTEELNSANEYIELVARQQGVNVRAFRDEAAAVRWLAGPAARERRYRFSRIVIAGAPDDVGVYALWEEDELVYYGRGAIRTRLLQHFDRRDRATHYSWELCADPAAREAALLAEHERAFGRPPRYNAA